MRRLWGKQCYCASGTVIDGYRVEVSLVFGAFILFQAEFIREITTANLAGMFVASGWATLGAALGGCVIFLSVGLSLVCFLAILGATADMESGHLNALPISAASVGTALECRIDEAVGVVRTLALLAPHNSSSSSASLHSFDPH